MKEATSTRLNYSLALNVANASLCPHPENARPRIYYGRLILLVGSTHGPSAACRNGAADTSLLTRN